MAEIRAGTPADVGAVVDCWVALAADQREHASHLLAEPNRLAITDSIAMATAVGLVVVAECGGRIVGFAMAHQELDGLQRDVTLGVVDAMYVEPVARGEGLGAALLAAIEAALARRGADHVALEVLTTNARARRFYADAGYRERRRTLEKPLDQPS
ncbi:MAG: GNAT family N-acetyltransferase [Haloquadratum sp.]|jgi:GNAT superfamily N-acetyltransferase|nr:GNAT family N-acetyltransferase [Haloferacaceae archaeon]MDR9445611.1 GNAT family N-acetyltransferase [Haloquadratum sp.]